MRSPRFFLFLSVLLCFIFFLQSLNAQESVIDSLEQALAQTSVPKEKVKLLLDLSYELVATDAEKALTYATESLSTAQSINYNAGIQNSYIQLAGIKATLGELKVALEMLDKGEPIAIAEKDTSDLLKFLQLRVAYHSLLGNLDTAMITALEHLHLAEVTGNQSAQGNALLNLGYLNADQGKQDFPKALEFYQQAIQLFREIKDEQLVAFSLLNISAVYESLEDVDASIKTAKEGIEIAQRIGQKDYLASFYAILSKAYYELQNKELAVDYMRKTVALTKELSFIDQQCKWILKLAQYLNEAEKYDEALPYLAEVKPLLDSQERVVYYYPYYEQLAIAQKGKGDYEPAFKNYALSSAWKDSAYEEIQLREFEEIQTKYETEKKEQENQLLAQQNDFLATQNQLYTYIGLGLAAVIAILTWLFYQIYKSKRQLEVQHQLIEAQKVQLEKLNETKDQFFAIIAHDMRNAVFSFRGISKKVSFLIKTNQLQRLQDIGSGMDNAVNNLTNLLNNLLEWALLQKGSISYDPTPIVVSEVVSEVLEMAQNIADVKQIELINQISSETKVLADRNALATIVRNLVGNAIKFTETDGKVTVNTRDLEGKTFIEINDTGTGISAQRMEKLFEIDKKKIAKGTAGEKGSGLGLMLVKELVEINKGTIEVFSDLGKGATFAFSMPRV